MRPLLPGGSAVGRNTLAFLVLSLAHLHVVHCLHRGVSALGPGPFPDMLAARPWVPATFLAAFAGVLWGARASSHLLALFCLVVSAESVLVALAGFDKPVLVLVFLHAVFSAHFLLFWELERRGAVYRPGFDRRSLGPVGDHDLPAEVSLPGGAARGTLTNWDENGVFLALEGPAPEASGRVSLSVLFEGRRYRFRGRVAARRAEGLGIRVEKGPGPLNWAALYGIISDRGHRPRCV